LEKGKAMIGILSKNPMKLIKHIIIVVILSLGSTAFAGPYADALSKKLVSSTTAEDKALFVRWMFVAMSLHPDLKEMSSITPQQRDDANRKAGELLTRLLTVTCVVEAKEALKYEGESAISSAFNLFGQIAGRELFTNQEVVKGLAGLEKYCDTAAFIKALK
jgi:hypothetical protein